MCLLLRQRRRAEAGRLTARRLGQSHAARIEPAQAVPHMRDQLIRPRRPAQEHRRRRHELPGCELAVSTAEEERQPSRRGRDITEDFAVGRPETVVRHARRDEQRRTRRPFVQGRQSRATFNADQLNARTDAVGARLDPRTGGCIATWTPGGPPDVARDRRWRVSTRRRGVKHQFTGSREQERMVQHRTPTLQEAALCRRCRTSHYISYAVPLSRDWPCRVAARASATRPSPERHPVFRCSVTGPL